MNIEKLVIRPMRAEEEKTVVKIARKAFTFIEALCVTGAKNAIVADYEGKLIGAIIYSAVNSGTNKIVYIDEAFVDPDYHGVGVGKKLYAETFAYLQEQGYDYITAMVKDDNVGSWKLCLDNGFVRTSLPEAVKHIGVGGLLKHHFRTPMAFATNMDFYMYSTKGNISPKTNHVSQLGVFLLVNLLFAFPLWIRLMGKPDTLAAYIGAYATLLAIVMLIRFCGSLFYKEKKGFRMNNCGGFLTILLGFLGSIFPMNANWYPAKYENSDSFRRKLAIPELVKWLIFSLLPLLAFTPYKYTQAIAELSSVYLILSIIPLYPFDAYGAGRIYRYKKWLWMVTAVISIVEMMLVF